MISTIGIALEAPGWVLILVSTKKIGEAVSDQDVFKDMLSAGAMAIAAIAVGNLVYLTEFPQLFMLSGPLVSGLSRQGSFYPFVGFAIGALFIWTFYRLAAFNLKRSYRSISRETNNKWFHRSGRLFLLGTATAIVLIGFLIVFVALILQVVAFYSIPDSLPAKSGHGAKIVTEQSHDPIWKLFRQTR